MQLQLLPSLWSCLPALNPGVEALKVTSPPDKQAHFPGLIRITLQLPCLISLSPQPNFLDLPRCSACAFSYPSSHITLHPLQSTSDIFRSLKLPLSRCPMAPLLLVKWAFLSWALFFLSLHQQLASSCTFSFLDPLPLLHFTPHNFLLCSCCAGHAFPVSFALFLPKL